jgi:Xaa-Pro aminopeptidase
MTVDDLDRRIRDAQAGLADTGADALILFPSRNTYYLTGFDEEPGERHLFLFVPSSGDPVFLVPELYEEQVRETVPDVRTWADGADPTAAVESVVDELSLGDGRLLVDDTMWARFTQTLREACPDATFGLASEVLASLRVHKDDAELDALGQAGTITDDVVRGVRDLGSEAVGMTERDLARHIERRLADAGGQGIPFGPLVGSGPNGALPHHRYGDRTIRAGDPVVLDFGTSVDGYPSDLTRTVVFDGEPPAAFPEVHELVRQAQQAAIEAVEPGATASDVDRAARSLIEAAGYGDQFVHRTGHGVGLDVHEEPYIVSGNDRELEPGMVFTVEPGVYLSGEFGVRIEDVVVVTENGSETLTDADRGWR